MSKIERLPRRQAPAFVPEELHGRTVMCKACGRSVEIQWLEKMPFPKQPIPVAVGGHYVPASIDVTCTHCLTLMHLMIPRIPCEGVFELFGDEAGRRISDHKLPSVRGDLYFFCITLVGVTIKRFADLKTELAKLKREAKPEVDSDHWKLHFTDIMDSHPENKKYSFCSKARKVEFGHRLAGIVKDYRPDLASFSCSGYVVLPPDSNGSRKEIKRLQQKLFGQSIVFTLQILREQRIVPRWTFDNIQDAKGTTTGTETEGWAQEAFLGLQDTRLFAWLSSCAAVLEPRFERAGSHICSELADFLSYCVARDFQKAVLGTTSEIPSRLSGHGIYLGILGDGTIEYCDAEGLPLKKFYDLNG